MSTFNDSYKSTIQGANQSAVGDPIFAAFVNAILSK
jgi:hypothetical protein